MASVYDCPKCLTKDIPIQNRLIHDSKCESAKGHPTKLDKPNLIIDLLSICELNNMIESKEDKKEEIEINKYYCNQCGYDCLLKDKDDHIMSHQFQEEEFAKDMVGEQKYISIPKLVPIEPIENESIGKYKEYKNENVDGIHYNELDSNESVDKDEEETLNIFGQAIYIKKMKDDEKLQMRMSEINLFNNAYKHNYDEYYHDHMNDDNSSHKPLPKRYMSQLTEIKIDNLNNFEEEKRSCIICYEMFQKDEKGIILPCIHLFHSDCIKNWFKSSDICPVCKYNIKTTNN